MRRYDLRNELEQADNERSEEFEQIESNCQWSEGLAKDQDLVEAPLETKPLDDRGTREAAITIIHKIKTYIRQLTLNLCCPLFSAKYIRY
ncbi:MAG: hypothetical protein MHMPM18_002175 [Marteilia pararefringens]